MPKNSRRKKATRQHPLRKGERYMRAWPITASNGRAVDQAPCTAADHELAYREMGLELIHRVQRVVESRGWVLPSFTDLDVDFHGMAMNTQVAWDYAPAFGGIELDEDDQDVCLVPMKPACRFGSDSSTGSGQIVVETGGSWGGCEQHRTVCHRLTFNEAGIGELPRLLAEVEEAARRMDLAPFVQCLANGPCVDRVRRRQEQAKRLDTWMDLVMQAREDLTEQQHAELYRWERENRDRSGHPGTMDWPGWVPLIGQPPPRPD